jgi:ribose transport system substrate-binding protein
MFDKHARTARLVVGLAGLAIVVGACGGAGGGGDKYHIGISNTLQGNGWREEMICSMKAEALVSDKVEKLTIVNRTTDTAGQIEDIRTLIAAGVDAIVLNPSSFDGLDTVIKEATDKGIKVVAVDQAVQEPGAYILSNNQEQYGYLGAKWLFETLGGKGAVLYMRGIKGVPADTDRDNGFQKALAEFPEITIAAEVFTEWSAGPAAQQMQDLFAAGTQIDGIWTSGIDAVIVDSFKTAGQPFVPIMGADNNQFVGYLNTEKANGLVGVAVTNPPPVGGAGVALALKLLAGEKAERVNLLVPEVWDNGTDDGMKKIEAAYDADLDPYYGVNYTIDGWTHYTKADLLSCKGPGE